MPKKKTLKGRFLQTGLLMLFLSLVIALVLRLGLESTDLKLLTALVVAVFLALPYWQSLKHHKAKKAGGQKNA